ncbi:hypothetical protein VSH64_41415 [Amycolatopsis rhabdoformis]|uniref:DUF3592 domain-containing protein n=1 Tax=Amycolatopsis rhabdoformis TaxID=1448059 RepID=A0ABZ1I462_9PSEU|nr:hypothetical protein [Amycolatopsis rhabdoformis]WSE29204.1 hypothetical protein VSH64_41415 [Amycolatopsis rhabdoformis]
MKADRLAELVVVVVGFALPAAVGAGVVLQVAGPSHVEAARVVSCAEVRDPDNPPTRYVLRFATAAGENVDVLSSDPALDTGVGTAVELTRSNRSGAVREVRRGDDVVGVRSSALTGPVWGGVIGVIALAYAVWLMVRGGKRALPVSLVVGLLSAVAGAVAGAALF